MANKIQFEHLLKYKKEQRKNSFDFCDDEEKMKDFFTLSKLDFLNSYSYLTEMEYNNTSNKIKNK